MKHNEFSVFFNEKQFFIVYVNITVFYFFEVIVQTQNSFYEDRFKNTIKKL